MREPVRSSATPRASLSRRAMASSPSRRVALILLLVGLAASASGVPTYRASFTAPDGRVWQEHVDPDSGETYFYDSATRESTWTDPRVSDTDATASSEPPDTSNPPPADDSGAAGRRDAPKRRGFTARDRRFRARYPANLGRVSGDDADDASRAPPAPHRHAPFVRGTLMVALVAAVSSGAVFGARVARVVVFRAGAGGVGGVRGGVNGYAALADETRREAIDRAARYTREFKAGLAARWTDVTTFARDVRGSADARDAARRFAVAARFAERAPETFVFARFLIALYYFNICADTYTEYVWRHQYWEYTRQYGLMTGLDARATGARAEPAGAPWFAAGVVVATTLMIHNISAARCSLCVLAYDVVDSVELLADVFVTGRLVLNELVMKKLAMFGATCLLVAVSWKDERGDGSAASPFAGVLFAEKDVDENGRERVTGRRKSAALLAARLLMAAMFFFVGAKQMSRVVARDFALFAGGRGARRGPKDGHDNNWLLAEFALGVPLAVGYKSEWTSRALVATLFLEAFLCWDFWTPGHSRPEHARSHFVTNMACGGGLILLQAFGAGRYTVDRYLAAKKKA